MRPRPMNPMVDALAVVDDNRTNEGCIAELAKGKMSQTRWWSSADRIWHVPLILIKEFDKLDFPQNWRM
jgi:hypothetical protein